MTCIISPRWVNCDGGCDGDARMVRMRSRVCNFKLRVVMADVVQH